MSGRLLCHVEVSKLVDWPGWTETDGCLLQVQSRVSPAAVQSLVSSQVSRARRSDRFDQSAAFRCRLTQPSGRVRNVLARKRPALRELDSLVSGATVRPPLRGRLSILLKRCSPSFSLPRPFPPHHQSFDTLSSSILCQHSRFYIFIPLCSTA
jgi:hypothetical protein